MEFFQIIHFTLISISRAIFNYWYLMIIWIVFTLTVKMRRINFYTRDDSLSSFAKLIESLFQGAVAGIVGSSVVVLLGLPIRMSIYLALLLPISILLSLLNIRYICFSYSATILGVLTLIFNGQKLGDIELPNIDINIFGLIALVGVFHLMESILIFFVGADHAIPIVSKRDDQIVMGHILQKVWPIPIAILFFAIGDISKGSIDMPLWWPLLKPVGVLSTAMYCVISPMIGILGYSSISFTETPKRRARKTSGLLFGYSVFLIGYSVFIQEGLVSSLLGIFFMAGIHEGIILFEHFMETRKPPIYTIPEKGVRILHVKEGGLAAKAGMKIGSVIYKVNGEELINTKHLKSIIANGLNFIWFETVNLEHKNATHEIVAFPAELEKIGLRLVPEEPRFILRYENLRNLGIMNLIKKKK